ncbi:hypothetical protein [Proteus mirabilis]|uniref:hypothetical protein n=1 Tax=Proteus mirabilis TaxID=584 RepID=UPI003F5D5018
MAVFFIMQLVGQVPAALWVIFGEDRFHWDATTIGISLAAFGILHSLAQAMITGPVAARLGERRALMLGMIADGTGYILLAFATRGWMAFPIGPACRVASECRRCKQCCPGRWMRNVRGSCKAHWRRSPA